jgi:hypothetical protein
MKGYRIHIWKSVRHKRYPKTELRIGMIRIKEN